MNLKEFYKPLWVFGLVLVGLIILVNIVIARSLGKPPAAREKGGQPISARQISPEIVQNSLSPDQPTRYDIIELDEKDQPRDSSQWDYLMKKTFQDVGLGERMRAGGPYQSMVISREVYQKRLEGVESLIRINEEKLSADPGNDVTRQQLNELNKLRSTLLETEKYFVE